MSKSTETQPVCLKLLSKEMFYKDPSDPSWEHDAEVERLFGSYDATVYWCDCTQEGRGPDEKPTNKRDCTRANRECYVSLEDLT